MKKITMAVMVALSLSVAGCGPTLQLAADTFGVDVVSETVKQKAYKAASVSFTAWESIQDGVERTGRLPRCDETVTFLCITQDAWDRIKEIEKKTSGTLYAAKPLIQAGTDDVTLLMSIPSVVHDAQQAINSEKLTADVPQPQPKPETEDGETTQ